VDIVELIKSAPLADLVIIGILACAFILGVMQGAIRSLLGIVGVLLAFVVAANVRDPLGNFLADNWTQFPHDYNHMLAFLIIFVLLTVGAILALMLLLRRTDIYPGRPVVDDIVGGFLAVLECALILLVLIMIFASYQMPVPFDGELDFVRQLHDILTDQSHVAEALRTNVAPTFVQLLSPLLPPNFVSTFR
jgi:uncharacterized membrane protein required for colicin V production